MITHIVLMKLVHSNEETIEEAKAALARLAGRIPQLRHLEIGVDIVHSYRSYDLALVAKFDSLEDLQSYLNHPLHVEVVKYLEGNRRSTVTVDYETP
jgi:Stress responsive A/B Barrel Domain